MDRYGIAHNRINFEITETTANIMPETALHNINRLVEAGLKFSLDDYGTGYSNIARMLSLPLSIVKLDKSLIQSMAYDTKPNDTYIVLENTFHMLHMLGRKSLAEGVENEWQARQIIGMGCEYIQGYYYAHPLTESEFLCVLAEDEPSCSSVLSV